MLATPTHHPRLSPQAVAWEPREERSLTILPARLVADIDLVLSGRIIVSVLLISLILISG